ncbi:MAG: hypothetical protein ACLFNU_02035 [Bacteroidales bacterium]
MKKIRYLLGFICFLIVFSFSCKSKFEIPGTWFIDKEEMYINGNLVNTVNNTDVIILFNEDGTGSDQKGDFLWELSESTLTIIDNGEEFEYTITLKENNKLIIEDRGFTNDEKMEDFIVLTLTR